MTEPDSANPELTAVPDVLPPVTTVLPLTPSTGLLTLLPLADRVDPTPALLPELEPGGAASPPR